MEMKLFGSSLNCTFEISMNFNTNLLYTSKFDELLFTYIFYSFLQNSSCIYIIYKIVEFWVVFDRIL
ncbi:hypothetical protein HanRHA438_Chr01g0030931 [Helianthus annuus]|nr:hypothetical protein HanRHA438_Chr01g0030931 [Helianthus annuus]